MSGYGRRPLLSAPPNDRPRFPVNSKHEYTNETGWVPSAGRHVDSSSAAFDHPPPFNNTTPSLFNPLPALYPTSTPAERSDLPRQQVDNRSSNFDAWLKTPSQSHGYDENSGLQGGDVVAPAAYQNDHYRASETANMCWQYQNGESTRTYGPGSSTECVEREAPANERYFARGPTFPQQDCRSGSLGYVSGEYTERAQPYAVDESRSWERDWRRGGSFESFEEKPAPSNRLPFADGGADLSNALLAAPARYSQLAAEDSGSQSQQASASDFRSPYGYSAPQRFQFGKEVAKSRGPSNDKGVRTTTKYYRKPQLKANPTKAAPKVSLVSLYCGVCKVKLNAESQALQHYAGKVHAKRMRLLTSGDSQVEGSVDAAVKGENNSGDSGCVAAVSAAAMAVNVSPSQDRIKQESLSEHKEQGDAGAHKREAAPFRKSVVSDPLIYCNLCGTSFNAAVQADLHYKGKKHKARVASSSRSAKNRIQGPGSATDAVPSKEDQLQQDGSDVTPAAAEPSAGIAIDSGGYTESGDSLASAAADTKTAGEAGIVVHESQVDGHTQEPSSSHEIDADSLKETKVVGDALDDSKKKAPAIKFSCDICNVALTSQVQLTQHLQGAKHARRARGVPSRPYNNGRKRPFAAKNLYGKQHTLGSASGASTSAIPASRGRPRGQKVGTNRTQPGHESAAAGPVPKRHREDVAQMRRDHFYCGWCNATCDTELSYRSHLESGRHKAALAFRQPSEMAYNY